MTKFIAPAVVVIIGIAVFFGFVDPTYEKIKELSSEIDQYNQALDRSRELAGVRDQLLVTYNGFREGDLERLGKLIPDNVDNVRLIMDIDSIAARYGLVLRGVSVAGGSEGSNAQADESQDGIQSMNLNFSVSSSYENFISFLEDLEQSLRLVDVNSLSFNASETDFYEFNVSLRTYWLR